MVAPNGGQAYAALLPDLDFHVNVTTDRWIQHHPILDTAATMFKIIVTAEPDDRVYDPSSSGRTTST